MAQEKMETTAPPGNSGNKPSEGSTALAERPIGQTGVTVSSPGTTTEGVLASFFGSRYRVKEPSGVQVLTNPENTTGVLSGAIAPGVARPGPDREELETWDWEGGRGQPPDDGEPPERPRGPDGVEYEHTPEWGRELVEKIVYMRTQLPYEVRYNEENGPILRKAYDDLQAYVDYISRVRNEREPFLDLNERIEHAEQQRLGLRPSLTFEQVITQALDERLRSRPAQVEQRAQPNPELPRLRPLADLTQDYGNLTVRGAERAEVIRQLGIYFNEARRLGLLKGVDQILGSIHEEIGQRTSAYEQRQIMEQGLRQATAAARTTFMGLIDNPGVDRLINIWEPYLTFAEIRLEAIRSGQVLPNIEGEWRPGQEQEEESLETYWRPSTYPDYYVVTARTPEQFRRAKESFLQMIKNHSLGYSPDEITPHLLNFKKALGLAGTEAIRAQERDPDGPDKVTSEFNTALRQEFEFDAFTWGADYNNESYNPKGREQYMEALALHEGPARFVRGIRSGEAQPAAFTKMFDVDLLMEVFTNPVGDRGELDIIAQHFLQDRVREIAIERGMGIQLKDYDPRDTTTHGGGFYPYRSEALFNANLERIGLHMSDEEFKNLYEGFDKGDAHKQNYDRFKGLSDQDLARMPKRLQRSIEMGRIQTTLDQIRAAVRSQRLVLGKGQTIIDYLSPKDQTVYRVARARAELNWEKAFQLQGITGEKVRRGKGFFYIDRNPHIQAYNEVIDTSERIKWLLGELEKYEKTKSKKPEDGGPEGKPLESFNEEVQEFYKHYFGNTPYIKLTSEQKEPDAQGLYGVKGRYSIDQEHSIAIGWLLSEINMEDRRLDSFTPSQQALFNSLSEEEKEVFADHMPVYLAEKFVQAAVTQAKIQHANSKAEDRTRAANQAREYAIEQVKKHGWKATLVVPKLRFDVDPNSPTFGEVLGIEEGETETITFKQATDPNNFKNRYTTHTYWGYQGENRHMILREDLFKAAKRIRAGISRPEDEDILAVQLLIIDPTLKRVKRFVDAKGKQDKGQIQREITLFQAAVNESFISRTRINKGLFRAFLPKDGSRGRMRAGYNMEDWGGIMRFTMGIKELAASQPARFTRRLSAEIANMPMYLDSMAAIWGHDGVMGAISMFADKIGDISHQRIVGQFGITKFIGMQSMGVELYNLLIGTVKEGQHDEGLYMKPTNDNDVQHSFIVKGVGAVESKLDDQWDFLQSMRKTFGRLEKVLKLMRPMYSDERNAGGALLLENVDIWLANGKFNPAIEQGGASMNTGTSRQLESDFYDDFTDWVISEWPGGGGHAYPNELFWNKFLGKRKWIYSIIADRAVASSRTFKEWFFEKAGL